MSTESSQNQSVANDVWTVRQILEWTTAHLQKHGSDSARLDAEILLAHARQCQRIDLYTRYNDILSDNDRTAMRELVQRRANAEPVAYLVGHREFFSLEFHVTPHVLIPRPDTETLVIELLELIKPIAHPSVLDLCTGSGCIAIASAVNSPQAKVTATDLSKEALAIAAKNSQQHSMQNSIQFYQGDLFKALPTGSSYDLIVSNPPYVREDEYLTLADDILQHEPRLALVSGADGLDCIRSVINNAPQYLTSGGHLLIEFSPEQATAVASLMKENGAYKNITLIKDLSGKERAIKAITL
ncbi:Peptide chain release factor N(5)-glutamine methyltransferase [hydrothermal vent metagenome]|uniref:peptide chain release factor N(5)-glutamine methyltransferase n=1 Tax=hydrothermal vent metagenome TaxID=652676 RepID=A0A3B1DH59_9ZZZZ